MVKTFIGLFALLCFGSLFGAYEGIKDGLIYSKWYWFDLVVLTGGIVILLKEWKENKLMVYADGFLGALICFFLWLVLRNVFHFWKVAEIALALMTCVVLLCFYRRSIAACLSSLFALLIAVACVLQACYGLLQYIGWMPQSGPFRVSGSYDNPAGFAACLSVGFPWCMYLFYQRKLAVRYFAYPAVAVVVIAIFLSASRAGILAIGVAGMVFVGMTCKAKRCLRLVRTGGVILLLLLLTGLYQMKKDSADGRLLIWKCSGEMIAEKPLAGWGKEGFKSQYMLCQARYFENHPDSKYSRLAGEVNHPFNEYMLLLVEGGVTGFLLLSVMVGSVAYHYRKNSSIEACIAFLSLLVLGVFACFSYPLRYPFTLLILLWDVAILVPAGRTTYIRGRTAFGGRWLALLVFAVFIGWRVWDFTCEWKWKNIADRSLRGENRFMLAEYKKLYPYMKKNLLFLYNYGAELNVGREYERCAELLQECETSFPTYEGQMLMAANYLELKRYEAAEWHYRLASRMCPVRFMPLYQLARLYLLTGRKEEFERMARVIIDKPVKVESPDVARMKNEMKMIMGIND